MTENTEEELALAVANEALDFDIGWGENFITVLIRGMLSHYPDGVPAQALRHDAQIRE